jgi:hypothetical protein
VPRELSSELAIVQDVDRRVVVHEDLRGGVGDNERDQNEADVVDLVSDIAACDVRALLRTLGKDKMRRSGLSPSATREELLRACSAKKRRVLGLRHRDDDEQKGPRCSAPLASSMVVMRSDRQRYDRASAEGADDDDHATSSCATQAELIRACST